MNETQEKIIKRIFNVVMIVVIAIVIAYLIRQTTAFKSLLPKLESGAGLGLVLIFGLLTSLHCIGMCGGLVLTYSVKADGNGQKKSKREIIAPPLLFNIGRVISYTIVGAIVGGIGQVLSLSGFLKGLIPIVGGVFMILMALSILGAFPFLRRFQIGAPKGVVKKIRSGESGPFILGLLMAIMPCGPLQMAEMYALTTGSVLLGAASMFVFSVGTVPSLFLLGCFGSFMSKRFSKAVMQCSAAVVIVLGITMVGKGLAVNGVPNPINAIMSPPMAAMTTPAPSASGMGPGSMTNGMCSSVSGK